MELAFQGLEKVLWASMGKRPQVVRGVEQAEAAADALRGDGRGYVFVFFVCRRGRGGVSLMLTAHEFQIFLILWLTYMLGSVRTLVRKMTT